MKKFLLFFFILSARFVHAQEDIVLNLDSIKNIKTTRYSSVNEVGVGISLGGQQIDKIPGDKKTTHVSTEKPNVLFRTVHGVLINPHIFIGGGLGIDFIPSGGVNGTAT